MSTNSPTSETAAVTHTAVATPAGLAPEVIPTELATELRRLLHDLSNSLEVVVQTSYLLSLAELKEPASEWLKMLETGVTRTLEINQDMRAFLRQHAAR